MRKQRLQNLKRQEDTDMKVSGQDMKVTLVVNGRERTFSEKELVAILESVFSNEVVRPANMVRPAKAPVEGEWFKVEPLAINQALFYKERENAKQESMRQLIVEAFIELKLDPEKYGKIFKTMMPKKEWTYKTAMELKIVACTLGDCMASWVEQALEWAQRIENGEPWENICNKPDTSNWFRAIRWKNGQIRLVGGSVREYDESSACDIGNADHDNSDMILRTVPLVMIYEE